MTPQEENKLTRTERNFADSVRRLREERGWSQDDLAERLRQRELGYMNQATVSRIENKTRPVRMVEAQSISAIFRTTVAAMMNPDGREALLSLLELGNRESRRRLVEFKELAARVASDQVRAHADLAHLRELYPSGEDIDPAVEQARNNLEGNIARFARLDLSSVAEEQFEIGRKSFE